MAEEKEVVVEETVDNVMAAVVHGEDDAVVSTKELLEAGVHFGHQTRRWNPAMGKYIYSSKNGIHIIDLTKTAEAIQTSYKALKKIVADGGKVLFVGTAKPVQEVVAEEATRSGSFYVTNRWLGGTLTNFRTIQKRIKYLNSLETMEADGTFETLPKKEVVGLKKEKEKLLKNLSGIKEMRRVPNAIVVVDPNTEKNAVAEAKKLGIKVFGIVDTNGNPEAVDYVIPANNIATKSVQLIVSVLADAVVEGKGGAATVAFNVKDEDKVSMEEALNSYDKAEELRQIRQKIREDVLASKKKDGKRAKPRKTFAPKAPKAEKPAEAQAPVEEATEAPAEAKKPARKPAAKKAAAPKAEESKGE